MLLLRCWDNCNYRFRYSKLISVIALNWAIFLSKGLTVKKPTKAQKKIGKVMSEYKEGTLHSGKGGPVVKSAAQAKAIALSEAGISKKRKKGK